jgi:hypothetical protein
MWCYTCNKYVPHRWRPSPEAGPYWRCGECGEPNPAEQEDVPITPQAIIEGAKAIGMASDDYKERPVVIREPWLRLWLTRWGCIR